MATSGSSGIGNAATSSGVSASSGGLGGATSTGGANTTGANCASLNVLAGDGNAGFLDGPGLTAELNSPQALVLSGTTLYVADLNNAAIRALDLNALPQVQVSTVPDGGGADAPVALTLVDGGLAVGNSGQDIFRLSPSTGASLDLTPNSQSNFDFDGMTLADRGRLVVASNNCLYSVSLISPNASPPLLNATGCFGYQDGALAQALFNLQDDPQGLAYEPVRDVLYVADFYDSVIRVIALGVDGGWVSTLGAFDGGTSDIDGPANEAVFVDVAGVAVDARGDVFVGETGAGSVREIQWMDGGAIVRTILDMHSATCDFTNGGTVNYDGTTGIAVNAAGTVVYLSQDSKNQIFALTHF